MARADPTTRRSDTADGKLSPVARFQHLRDRDVAERIGDADGASAAGGERRPGEIGPDGKTAGHPPRLTAAGRSALGVVGLVRPELRELRHTLYQFTEPWVVDDTKFRTRFGDLSTPLWSALSTLFTTQTCAMRRFVSPGW